MAVREPYQYFSELQGRTIRLLKLHYGEDESDIHCSLVHYNLDADTNLTYFALSYVWADPQDTCTIVCDEKSLAVTRNLHAALRQLRRRKYPSELDYLWVDAVCINQSNLREKSRQVQMMRQIYSSAKEVLAWLGEEPIRADSLELLYWLYKETELWQDSTKVAEARFEWLDYTYIEKSGMPPPHHIAWNSLLSIFQKPWFRRVWVIQEFLASTQLQFLCRDVTISSDVLVTVADALSSSPMLGELQQITAWQDSSLWCIGLSNLGCMDDLKYLYEDAGSIPMRKALSLTISFEATNLRDKVYALIGLDQSVESRFIDYDLDIDQVLIETAILWLSCPTQTGDAAFGSRNPDLSPFDMLSFAGSCARTRHNPSWVPDWTSTTATFPHLAFKYPTRFMLAESGSKVRFSNGDNVLELRGFVFDRVKSKQRSAMQTKMLSLESNMPSLIMQAPREAENVHRQVLQDWLECSALVQGLESYPTGQNLAEVHWRAMILDEEERDQMLGEMCRRIPSYLEMAVRIGVAHGESVSPRRFENAFKLLRWLNLLFFVCWEKPRHDSLWSGLWNLLKWLLLWVFGNLAIVTIYEYSQLAWRRTKYSSLLAPFLQAADELMPFLRDLKHAALRQFCVTEVGYVGWLPPAAQIGDELCFFDGSRLPYLLRKRKEGYQLIGDCYLHGLMADDPRKLEHIEGTVISLI